MFKTVVLLAILAAPALAFVVAPGTPPSEATLRSVIFEACTGQLEERRVEEAHNRLVANVEEWREELRCLEAGGVKESADQLRRRIAVTEADIKAYQRGSWLIDLGLVARQ